MKMKKVRGNNNIPPPSSSSAGKAHGHQGSTSASSLPSLASLGSTIGFTNNAPKPTAVKSNKQSIKFFKSNDLTKIKQANKSLKEQMGDGGKAVKPKSHTPSGFLVLQSSKQRNNEDKTRSSTSQKTPNKGPSMAIFHKLNASTDNAVDSDENDDDDYQVVEDDITRFLCQKLTLISKTYEGKVHKELVIGFNGLTTAIERNLISILCINKDWKQDLIQLLVELAMNKQLPFLLFSFNQLFQDLQKDEVLKIKRWNCFGVRSSTDLSSSDSQPSEAVAAVMDDIRDYLLSQAKKVVY